MASGPISAVDYKEAAKAVAGALAILRRGDVLTEDERKLLAGLQDAYIGLIRHGSRADQLGRAQVPQTANPYGIRNIGGV